MREYDEEGEDDVHQPGSPPLPPIPDNASDYLDEDTLLNTDVEDMSTVEWHEPSSVPVTTSTSAHPPPPSRPHPTLPLLSDMHPEVAPVRCTSPLRPHKFASQLDCFPAVPPLPAAAVQTPPQAPFSAILVSAPLSGSVDPTKIIVSLETSTATHRTTMSTLTSRPSHLASYLLGLLPSSEADTRSVYSTTSEVDSSFNSIFHHHLASSGALHASTNLHVFLDRPSAP